MPSPRMGFAPVLAMAVALGSSTITLAKTAPSSEPEHVGFVDAAIDSITGDVYAEPSR